jgi:hypothetical protein
MAFDFDEDAVFDADQPRQLALAFVRVGVLDQQCRLPVAAVGHQRRVGVDLALDAVFVEDFFDVQHLLDLAADRLLVFELQRDVLTEMHAAQLAVRNRFAANGLARL